MAEKKTLEKKVDRPKFSKSHKTKSKRKGTLNRQDRLADYADDIKKDFAEFKVLHDSNVLQSLKPIQTKYEGKAIEEGREVFTYITDLNA